MSTQQPRIFITDQDYHRLTALVGQAEGPLVEALDEELSRAHVMSQKEIPKNVVTMNSRIQFVDEATGQKNEMTLVYPQDANVDQNKLSILAPIGMALLGLTVGQEIDWKLPNGQKKRLKVEAITYQPEADGQFEL